MPYASDRDRNPRIAEIEKAPWPQPPLNLFLTSGFQPGVFDLSWDDPAILAQNSSFFICGINIYRSFDSEFGPFERITDLPLGSTFWRDQTDNVVVIEEEVTSDRWLLQGDCVGGELDAPRWVFRTRCYPIVREGSQNLPTDNTNDVIVKVDGVQVPVQRLVGASGEIEIDNRPTADVGTQSLNEIITPGDNSVVTVTYRYTRSFLRTDLMQRVFYRVTTVGVPLSVPIQYATEADHVETPLQRAVATSSYEIEKLDWMWREAVRRNRWILDQGGERVKVFLRKNVGVPCHCTQNPNYKQGLNDCELCYGTRIVGGYEGPYDIKIAPDDAERRISQTDRGRTVEHIYEAWTGPTPLLSQRDFVMKLNGDRYAIGPVRMPTNRGMVLQQHFNIGHLDEQDIRYRVPIGPPRGFVMNELVPVVPPQALAPLPDGTDKPNIGDERELRGRTVTWENIVY